MANKKTPQKVEEPKVETPEVQTPVSKPATITAEDVLAELSKIEGISTNKRKSNWIAIKDKKTRAYIKTTSYGVSVWSLKANEGKGATLKIINKNDLEGFISAIKKNAE
jgi:septal ring-binding cell division protein DamX